MLEALDPPLRGAECVVMNAVASVPASVIIIMPLDVASDLKSGFKNKIAKIAKKNYTNHTWASSKSPGEGVQFFFSRGGLIFQNRGGPGGGPLQKFSLEFHRVIQINKKYRKIGHLLL